MTERFLGIWLAGALACLAACSASASPGDCDTLPTCCDQLSNSADKSECKQVVAMGDATGCADAQTAFEVDNLCTVTASIAPSGGGCSSLSTCCSSLSSAKQAECNDVVTAGVEASCSDTLTGYMADGVCN